MSAAAVRYPLVTVQWVDSCATPGWQHTKDLIKDCEPSMVRSVGWVVRETDSALVLAPHIAEPSDDNEQLDGLMAIPKVAIVARAEMQDALT